MSATPAKRVLPIPGMDERIATGFHIDGAGSYFPTKDKLKERARRTLEEVQSHISDVKKNRTSNVEALLANHSEQYFEDALDRYNSYDVAASGSDDPSEWQAEAKRSAPFVNDAHNRPRTVQTMRFVKEAEDLILAHTVTIQSLHTLSRDLEKGTDDSARRKMQSAFPQTIAEYQQLPSGDKKRAVARFLAAPRNSPVRDNLIQSQQDWSWRAVYPLLEAFYLNPAFMAEIRTYVKSFESNDPRKRSTVH